MNRQTTRGRATRLSRKKFKTETIQGPGSFVIFNKPTYLESQEMLTAMRPMTRNLKRLREDNDADAIFRISDEIAELIFDAASEKFEEWNWVDEEGEELPGLPDIDPKTLLNEEVDFIMNAVRELYGIVAEDDLEMGKSVN